MKLLPSVLFILFTFSLQLASAGELKIRVDSDQIRFQPPEDLPTNTTLQLVERLPFEDDVKSADKAPVWEGTAEAFPESLPRFSEQRDRLYSRWALVEKNSSKPVPTFVYGQPAREIAKHQTAVNWPASPKGLQCVVDVDDALNLGVKYVAQNVDIRPLFDFAKQSELTWNVDGQRIHFDLAAIRHLDSYVSRMTKAGVNVSFILLNYIPTQPDANNPLIHPSSNLQEAPNHLGAFNLSDENGYRHYRAVVEFLADRYSAGNIEQGTISGIIVGNELQAHWWWYNLGQMKPEEVIAEYARALRVAQLAAAKAHPDLRVYVSLDQHWTARMMDDPTKFIPGKQFMEGLHQHIVERGDFPWHMAQHPYPQNLFNSRTWNDEQATFDINSPKITFRNLEVLMTWLNQPEHLYEGKPRRVILSEQGFHCEDGPEGEKIQAAAYAYAFYRTRQFEEIDAFILHRHVDHAHEGGLRLGLRAFKPGTISSPGTKRMSYDLFQHADDKDWQTHFEFAKPIIGIQSWSELDPKPVKTPSE
ncbi:hypothetical protein Pla110_14000 [Polystyrenella longa]|uniref:DUF5722 domain-containing protein n=1 Tax=Polystyrenella longa TaxID=2528007 RepID=A0A518CKD4_9PLAN|nr:DUF5722 domain-containing protein [Polystyrenella longa]QDU79686.1 hypothetical protein Pla110_14000 [Polystyrenella longa]